MKREMINARRKKKLWKILLNKYFKSRHLLHDEEETAAAMAARKVYSMRRDRKWENSVKDRQDALGAEANW